MPTGKEAVPRPLEQQENPPITNPQNCLLRTEERLKHKYGQNIDPNDVPKLLPQLQALAPKIETLLAENNIPRILLESGLYDTVVRNIESQKFNKPSHFKVVLEGFSTAEVERQIRICKADMVPFGFGDIFREDTDESFGKAVKAKDHEDGSD